MWTILKVIILVAVLWFLSVTFLHKTPLQFLPKEVVVPSVNIDKQSHIIIEYPTTAPTATPEITTTTPLSCTQLKQFVSDHCQ